MENLLAAHPFALWAIYQGSCHRFCHFLLKNGTIDCVVIGKKCSSDLPQGGLEIPSRLIFNGKCDDIKKLKHFLACKTPAFSSKI